MVRAFFTITLILSGCGSKRENPTGQPDTNPSPEQTGPDASANTAQLPEERVAVASADAPEITSHDTSPSSVSLYWRDNSSEEEAFVVDRRRGEEPFTRIATIDKNSTEYTDPGLQPLTIYEYRVSAVKADGTKLQGRPISVATKPDCKHPLPPPERISAPKVTEYSARLEWAYDLPDALAVILDFRVERMGGSGSVERVGDGLYWNQKSGRWETGFRDVGLKPRTDYTYRVVAYLIENPTMECVQGKNMLTVTTPDSPIRLSAWVQSSDTLRLSWTIEPGASVSNPELVRIIPSYPYGTSTTEVPVPDGRLQGLSGDYVDTGLFGSSSYRYRIRAQDPAEAESDQQLGYSYGRFSDEVEAATPSDPTLLYEIEGKTVGEDFGYAVAGLGDVDGDSKPDFVVGAPGGEYEPGGAYVFSGGTGQLLFEMKGTAAGDRFGVSVGGAGDVDGDGKPDVLVGAEQGNIYDAKISYCGRSSCYSTSWEERVYLGPGQVYVYAGANGRQLYAVLGTGKYDHFGRSVGPAGDVNSDGKPDLLVGAPQRKTVWPSVYPAESSEGWGPGEVYVLSGADGTPLLKVAGRKAGDAFGSAVASVGDISGDGRPDFVVGAPNSAAGGPWDSGSVYAFSGADGTLLHSRDGARATEHFGYRVALVGDLTGDGVKDYAATSVVWDVTLGPGKLVILSGKDGTVVLEREESIRFFGETVSSGMDLDGDGINDVVVGASRASPRGLVSAGSTYAYSGSNGRLIWQRNGPPAPSRIGFGKAVALIGDMNSDGRAEYLATGGKAPTPKPGAPDSMGVVSLFLAQ